MNIIGIGTPGCRLAKFFEEFEQYKSFYVDTENNNYSNFVKIKKQNSHEDYEMKFKKLKLNLDDEEVTLIVNGCGDISGCTLRILEQLKSKKITVLYLRSDLSQLSQAQKMKHRITFGVLQQYARSNVIDMLYVVSNERVEKALKEVSLKDYWRDINKVIFSTFHMINVFKNTEPLLTTSVASGPTMKIATFGVINYETNKEILFYDLEFPRNKKYFYGINNPTLENDKEILHKIRSFVGDQAGEEIDAGFSIFPTNYDHNYVYSVYYSSLIQEQKIE